MTNEEYWKIIYEKAWDMRTKEEDEANSRLLKEETNESYSRELRCAYALARREYITCVIWKHIRRAEEQLTRKEARERYRHHA